MEAAKILLSERPDISSWEIKVDPKHLVSRDGFYEQFALKQDVREGDILMVKVGTYLIVNARSLPG